MISKACQNQILVTKRKVNPSTTAFYVASILDMLCNLESNNVTKEIHHRVRELNLKLKKIKLLKLKISKSKKYLERSIERSLEIREISKELQELALKIGKLHDKVIMPDIKNAISLARAAAKSALENIKINKDILKKL